jgi:long-chain fatty acid transport protein
MNFSYKKLFSCITFISLSIQAQAGSFSLYTEGSVSAVQNFAAGIAAEGRDASVGWYNPAALVLLKKMEFVGGGIGVIPVARLSGTSRLYQYDPNDETDPILYGPYTESFHNLDGGREAIVPNFHFAMPFGDKIVYGASLVAPFGLSSNWPESSAVRYAGTYSNLRVIDFAPEAGALINDHFALGLGVDFQWANVNFDNVIGAPAVLPILLPGVPVTEWDTTVKNSGKSFGMGFHAGFLTKWNDDNTRFGFNYLYGVTQNFKGTSQVQGMFADGDFLNTDAYAVSNNLRADPVKFPDIMTFSLFHKMTDKVDVMGSIVYSMWSSFKSITLYNIPVASIPDNALVLQNATAIQNYRDTFRLAFGLNYKLTDKWELRGGTGWDQTPTNNTDRDIRLPDADKYALAVGAHWQPTDSWGFDIGYSYLWPLQTATVNKTQYLDSRNWVVINATGHAYAQLLALGLKWRM